MQDSTFIGLDVHKATISVAVGLCCTNRVENVLQMDLAYGLNDRYAESRTAVEDGDADLDLRDSPLPSALIPVLSIRRFNGPAPPRYGRLTFSVFRRRQRVLKSGADQSSPTNRSKL